MKLLEPHREGELLSKDDALRLLDIIHASVSCTTEDAFRRLIAGMKGIIPFEAAACLMGKKTAADGITRYELINISYPQEWLYQYVTKNYHTIDPIVRENFRTFSTQRWSETFRKYPPPKQFIKEAMDFGLKKGYSAGQSNLLKTEGSLFSFAGDCIEPNPRTEIILGHLTPHLHTAFIRVLKNERHSASAITLTSREKEILCWVKDGKSTWDISEILGIGQNTVKFHLKNIFKKLDTNTRSHAIAIALEKRLIDL